MQTRSDVANFVKKNKPTLLLVIPNSPLFDLPAIFDFVPDCKIIHIIRKGADVARQIEEKGWWSDEQLTKPMHSRVYYQTTHKGKPFYVPCWIEPKDAKRFIKHTEYERAFFYWCSLAENMVKSLNRVRNKKRQIMTIKFDDFIKNPRNVLTKINSFLNIRSSSMTEKALQEICGYQKISENHPQNYPELSPKLPHDLLVKAKKIYKHFGYGWD